MAATTVTLIRGHSDEIFQNETEETEGKEKKGNRPGVLRCGFCVKQGNVVSALPDYQLYSLQEKLKISGGKKRGCIVHLQRKSWKRRFFTLDDNAVSYYKSDTVTSQHAFHLFF